MSNLKADTIVLTGGGTTGHVAVNLALIPMLLERGWRIYYIGSENGIERELIADFPEVDYFGIPTGKLRRYLTWENVKDFGRVFKGIHAARKLIKRLKPDVIFSKGGFVSVPVLIGGFLNGVPSITHESDLTPGLANRLSFPFVKEVMVTFESSMQHVPAKKGYYLGPVIRKQIQGGSRARGLEAYGFSGKKPVLVVLGGSLGAAAVNQVIWDNLDALLERYDILHGVGRGKGDASIRREGYVQVEYIKTAMSDTLAMADIIVSRAGSNAIFEFLYYRKPMLLIPLGTNQSRGDQILNAEQFVSKNYARVLFEAELTTEAFFGRLDEIRRDYDAIVAAQSAFPFTDATARIVEEVTRIKKLF